MLTWHPNLAAPSLYVQFSIIRIGSLDHLIIFRDVNHSRTLEQVRVQFLPKLYGSTPVRSGILLSFLVRNSASADNYATFAGSYQVWRYWIWICFQIVKTRRFRVCSKWYLAWSSGMVRVLVLQQKVVFLGFGSVRFNLIAKFKVFFHFNIG